VTAPRSVERHHLFPKAFLAKKGVTGVARVNAIANMAFLDWPDNAKIKADDPAEFWSVMTSRMPPQQVKRQAYWHALPVGWEQLPYATFLERRRSLIAKVVRDGFNQLREGGGTASVSPATASELIAIGESQNIEFKSTARWNVRSKLVDKKMEHVIAKTICGFMNAEGGTLLIGVDDEGAVFGLSADLDTLGAKNNLDGYELFLRQHLDKSLSVPTAGIVKICFEKIDGQDVCLVSTAASGRPVFARPEQGGHGPTEFWVRIGNATKQLHGDDMIHYRDEHWG